MILTELPDLPPRPQTPANAGFRTDFYRHWGIGNWIVAGAARRAEYSRFRQTLSIKCVSGGTESYWVDGRRIPVSDDSWLVLNEGRVYSSMLESTRAAHSFAIFFRPGMAEEVAGSANQNMQAALAAGPHSAHAPVEFREALRSHDRDITPALRFIRRSVEMGARGEQWLEEQLLFLLERMLHAETTSNRAFDTAFADQRAATREELRRRLALATDFMRANLAHDLTLQQVAAAALLSPYHFLRQFRRAYGTTPMKFLRALRLQRARELQRSSSLGQQEIAAETGISRATLWRARQAERRT